MVFSINACSHKQYISGRNDAVLYYDRKEIESVYDVNRDAINVYFGQLVGKLGKPMKSDTKIPKPQDFAKLLKDLDYSSISHKWPTPCKSHKEYPTLLQGLDNSTNNNKENNGIHPDEFYSLLGNYILRYSRSHEYIKLLSRMVSNNNKGYYESIYIVFGDNEDFKVSFLSRLTMSSLQSFYGFLIEKSFGELKKLYQMFKQIDNSVEVHKYLNHNEEEIRKVHIEFLPKYIQSKVLGKKICETNAIKECMKILTCNYVMQI